MMRSVLIVSLAVFGLTQNAFAADPAEDDTPYLRGSEVYTPPAPKVYTRWSGFYAGGQVEYGSANLDFSKATNSLAAYSLRYLSLETETNLPSMQLLDSKHTGGAGFGGFVGYSTQWEDVVLGLELGYTRNSFSGVATSNPLNQNVTAGGIPYNVQLDGAASMHIIDYGEIRGRVGYAIGCFLPYFTGGFAVGRVDFTRSWILNGTAYPNTPQAFPFTYTNSETKNNAFVGGWSIGAGVDVQLWQRAFLRGEVDYISFAPISGIQASIVAGRLGAGVRF
jgi:opacity protein-like surface antigen